MMPGFLMVHRDDVRDRRTWSGIPFKMHEALLAQGARVTLCDRLGYPRSLRLAIENRALRWSGRTPFYRPRIAECYAQMIRDRANGPWDVVLAVDSIVEVARLDITQPIIQVSDATKTLLMEAGYPGYNHFSPQSQASIRGIERSSYQRAALAVFSSQWAADGLVRHYGFPRERVAVVPFGANIDCVPPPPTEHHSERCELLFLGVEWERKRGALAVEIARELNRLGVKTRLTVCGVTPPIPESDQLRVIPFLDKNKTEDRARLGTLLAESSYLILPSRAECSPIVFCEAAAHGLPSISCDVGGVSEIILHGQTGFVLPTDATAVAFAVLIAENFQNQPAYRRFRGACRARYDSLLNWDVWARRIIELARSLTAQPKRHESSAGIGAGLR